MAPMSRDRISVDLRGMKTALVARALERGVTPSDFVRAALEPALRSTGLAVRPAPPRPSRSPDRVRISLRMQRCDAETVLRAAREAGLAAGDFVAALANKAPVRAGPAGPAARLAALTASCAELATLSRNLHHLTTLLRQGSSRAAQEYREMLDTINADVRAHLALATPVVAELQPLIRSTKRRNLPAAA